MTVRIPLRLRGIDLRDVEAYDRIDPELAELSWEADGGVSLAVLYSDDPAHVAVQSAADWAKLITKLMPGVTIADVHDELVSVPDIAARAGVAAEAVRLWAAGRRRTSLTPFPSPRQVVGKDSGGKTMSLYAWREVVSWIREVVGTDPDEDIEHLTDAQLADLNAELATSTTASAWRPISLDAESMIADVQRLCRTEIVVSAEPHPPRPQNGNASIEHVLKLRVPLQ